MWTDEDRGLALEWDADRRGIHRVCGQPLDQVLGEEHDGAWITEEATCHACAAVEKTRRALQENAEEGTADLDGVVIIPVYRPDLRRG